MTPFAWRLLRGLLTLVAGAALLFALRQAIQDAEAVALPGPGRLAFAAGLLALGLLMAGGAWSRLLGVGFRRAFPGFVLAQLAKYVPGSVWQGVGQVADAHRLGIATGTASLAFVVQLVLQVIAAGAASALALAAPTLPWWLRAAAALAPLSLILIDRRWLTFAVRSMARWSSRLRAADPEVPPQHTLFAAAWRSTATIVAIGASYAVLLPLTSDPRAFVATAGVFMLAWLLGFLVVPLPAGLGVREAVLVAGLSGLHATADILAAAVVGRLLLIVVEAAIALAAQPLRLGTPSR